MPKPIALTKKQHNMLKMRILEEYPLSVWAIREKTKRVLGFTIREHTIHRYKEFQELVEEHGYRNVARKEYVLDFYSEKKQSWFLLKFSDIINGVEHE
mgnify:CR=1 FL=1